MCVHVCACVRKGYLSFNHSREHSPSSPRVSQVLFSIATLSSPNHSGRCSSLHMAPDTRWGLCDWTHLLPGKQVFRLC